jgi:hypothetical protein
MRTLQSLWSKFPLYVEPGGHPINDELLIRDAVSLIDDQVAMLEQLRDQVQARDDLIERQADIIRKQEDLILSVKNIVDQAVPSGVAQLAASAA